jgi:hypothetical protein
MAPGSHTQLGASDWPEGAQGKNRAGKLQRQVLWVLQGECFKEHAIGNRVGTENLVFSPFFFLFFPAVTVGYLWHHTLSGCLCLAGSPNNEDPWVLGCLGP